MPRKKTPSTIELGLGGLKHFSGQIDEEWNKRLQGTRGAAFYEEMRDSDPLVGAVLYNIEGYLRRVEWEVKPADDSDAAAKEAEFLESCMQDMETTWEEFVSDVLSFLVYGHSLHEIVYKVRVGPDESNPRYYSTSTDGRYGWRTLALRPQTTLDRWDIEDGSGRIKGVWQATEKGETAYLPMSRCVLFRTKTFKNNPLGRSVLRNAVRPYYFKKKLEEIEAIGASRDLSGMPVVEIPTGLMGPNATADQKAVRATMERLVSQIHRDEREGIVFPSEVDTDGKPTGYKLKLLSSPGGKQIPADPIIRRYDSRIAMTMAAEFLMLGTEKQGSFALGAEKSTNFLRALMWYVQTIAATLNRIAVDRLYDVNGVPPELRAKIVPCDLEPPDLGVLGLFLKQTGEAGFMHPTPAIEERIRELAHLPEEEDALEGIFAEEKKAKADEAKAAADALKNPPTAPGAKPPPTVPK